MPQAAFILPEISPIELLLADYEAAAEEKARAYAMSEVWAAAGGPGAQANFEAAEEASDLAYEAVEIAADMILAEPARSQAELAIKARVLSFRDPYHQVAYRPEDLTRFVHEVSNLVPR